MELEDIPILHQAIAIHSCLVPVKAELDQLREGLGLFNVHKLVTAYPAKMEKLFVFSGLPVHLRVIDFLALIEYNYSESGSNQREKEEQATMHWSEFLMELENRVAGRL